MKRPSIIPLRRLASQHCALAVAVCAAVASPGTARADNLVLNGEFDTAAFAPSPGNAVAAKIQAGITGWSLSGRTNTYVNGQWVAPSGTNGHWLLLYGTMTQTLANLPAGEYTISFDWFRRRVDVGGSGEEMTYHVTGPGGLSVTGDTTGNQVEGSQGVWHHESQTVTLTTAGDVTLTFTETGNDWGIGMDNMAFAGPGTDGDKVVNGNLETVAALAPTDGNALDTIMPGGITDWSLTGATTNYVNGQWIAPSGTNGHWLLLQGVMTQTITNVPAGDYTFNFDWFRRRSNQEEMAYHVTGPGGLSVIGNTTGNQTPSVWNSESKMVSLATAGDVTISFAVTGADWGIGIDKVALAPPLGPQKNITGFTFPTYGAATITGTNITKTVPHGTSVTAMAPTFSLSAGASCVPTSGTTRNFSSSVHYIVTASDDTTNDYTVTVTVLPPGPPVTDYARWFDASALGLGDGDPVTQWNDSSDNGANATVPDGNATPVYVADSGTESGLGAIYFAGNSDANNSAALRFTQDSNIRTVFSVFKGCSFLLTDSDVYNFHRETDDNPASPIIINYDAAPIVSGQTYVNTVLVDPEITPMPTNVQNGFNLVEILTDGRTVNADSFNKDRSYHAGNQYQAEVIIYDRVLTEAERLAVETYLTSKWFTAGGTTPASYTTWAADPAHTLIGGSSHVGQDGLSNLLVYALDLKTDGTNGTPGKLDGNKLTFTKRTDAVTNKDITYNIETSADLGVTDPWTLTTTGVTNSDTAIDIDLSTLVGSKRFARLVVTQQ